MRILSVPLLSYIGAVVGTDDVNCSTSVYFIPEFPAMFEFILGCAFLSPTPPDFTECNGYEATTLWLYNSSGYAEPSCVQPFVDLFADLSELCLESCFNASIASIYNSDCAPRLLTPLNNFAAAFGNEMDILTGTWHPRCNSTVMSDIDLEYRPYRALVAMGLKNEPIGDPMVQLNRLLELYYQDGDVPFLKTLEVVPCGDCFAQFLQDVASTVEEACFVSNETLNGCHYDQAVVMGNDLFFPSCRACQNANDEAYARFILCAGGRLTSNYMDPRRPVYAYNETAEPKCNDTLWSSSYYGFAKCALQFPNDTGSDALECVKNDLVLGPDFRLTPCTYAWGNMTLALPSDSGFTGACAADNITGASCVQSLELGPSPLADFQAATSNPNFTFSNESPYTCNCAEDSDAIWVHIFGRPGLLLAVLNSYTPADVVEQFRLNPVLQGKCVQCVADVAITLLNSGNIVECALNVTGSICPDLEYAIEAVYPACSTQPFNIPMARCLNDTTVDWSTVPPSLLLELAYIVAVGGIGFWETLREDIPENACLYCLFEFSR